MSDFDYGNARLRAMKARLLSRQTLEGLAEAGSVPGLITALTNTAYREAVEAALARSLEEPAGLECLAEAVRNDLVATVGKARSFFRDQAGELAALVLRRYDLHNVKAVLRGLAQHVPANEILASTLPMGALRPADLAELARSANFRGAVDLLTTWAVPLSRPLLELRARRQGDGADVPEMELALDRWHLHTAMQVAREAGDEGKTYLEALRREADAVNIMTALRLVGVPDAAATLRAHFGTGEAATLLIGPGHVPLGLLAEAARKPSVTEAVSALAGTPYGPTLQRTMDKYAAASRLSVFERALARRQLQQAVGFFASDPLGIGVLLGYVALKTNEVANLRAIAQGLVLGEKPDRIRAELTFAD
jgi:V/A-type H+-transporting ATPase subunit C